MSRNQAPQMQNRFIPQLEALEDRFLLSSAFTPPQPPLLPDSPPINFPPSFTGALANQFGSLVYLNLGYTPNPSLTIIVQDGGGNAAVAWDGGPFAVFHGVSQVDVHSLAQTNIVAVYNLPFGGGNFPAVNLYEVNFFTSQAGFLVFEHLAAVTANGHSAATFF